MPRLPSPIGSWIAHTFVLVVVCLPLCPPAHAHRAGIEGRTEPLIHTHAPQPDHAAGASGSALEGSHGEHGLAVFLNSDYIRYWRVAPVPPAAVSPAPVVPTRSHIRVNRRESAVLAHGPPRRGSITRGPPSLG